MDIHPITLTGRFVRLEPLSIAHAPGLWRAGDDPDIWRYIPYGEINSLDRMRWWVEEMLQRQSAGNDLPFAVIDLKSGQPVGATRYMTIERGNRSLEIGGTWYGKAYRRTAVNTESKHLLLGHAFDRLGCVRVQFRTDLRNERSQKALERLGATREAVLRKHLRMPDGYQRSSVIYSILDDEWPQVKVRLEKILHGP